MRLNPTTGGATYFDGGNTYRTTQGGCVTADNTGPASFTFSMNAANYRWQEYQTGF